MKKKLIAIAAVPVLGLGLLGASVASAHGWFTNATPEEIATHQQDMFQHQADLLGVSVDVIKDGWANGKTLRQIAEENGITVDQLQQKMQVERQDQMRSHLQTLVDQGVVTQAQADTRLKLLETKDNQFEGRGMMMHRGHMDMGWF